MWYDAPVARPTTRPSTRKDPATGLTEKQARFAREYALDGNGTQAALRAGYSARTAGKTATGLVANSAVQRAIQAKQRAIAVARGATPDQIKSELAAIAFARPMQMFDDEGRLRPPAEWPDELQACVASFEVVRRNVESGDGHRDIIWKVKFWDKVKALELLGRHTGMWGGEVDTQVERREEIARMIKQGRERWYRWVTNGGVPPVPRVIDVPKGDRDA